jgi:hypothetical protein
MAELLCPNNHPIGTKRLILDIQTASTSATIGRLSCVLD